MDFEAVNWDVGNEACELDNSLFKKNKKKRQNNSQKRRKEEKEAIPIDDNVTKKRKLSNEEKDNSREPKDSINLSNSASLSRKEKRDKKWQEKILRRKQMSDTKDLNANKVNPKLVSEVPEKQQTNSQSSKIEGAPPMSRAEKRKAKWEIMQEKRKLRLEHGKTGNQSKANTDHNQGDKSVITGNDREKVSAEGQINRKERKKLLWKLKLKERKLSQKNEKENETKIVNEKKLQKDSELKDKNGLNSKSQNTGKQGSKSKKGKHGEGEKHNTIDENKQLHSPNKKDMEGNMKNESMDQVSDSVEKKMKRKRTCKRNKFKGYVKPEKGIPKLELESGEELMQVTAPEKLEQSLTKTTTNTQNSNAVNTVNNKSKNLNNKTKKKKGISKNNIKDLDDGAFPAVEEKKVAVPKVSDNIGLKKKSGNTVAKKEGKKISLDRSVLKKMLSPVAMKKIPIDDSIVVEENYKNDNDDDNGFNRKKEDNDTKGKTLLEKSRERLNAARFRYLNEQLYTTTGQEALKMFRNDDVAFSVYHEGFQSQVEKWPTNPIDVIIEKIQSKPKHLVLADFGCGDAKLALTVPNKVHSFDLVALNDHVTVCDVSKVPLKDGTVDIAVFCLSLMGTNLTSYLKEANRILKSSGTLMIAEVSSRFHSVGSFVLKVEKMGFKIKNQDATNKMFVMMEFRKTADSKNRTVEDIELKPCIYKKR